ncbi:tetratricopeptide repeat protein [Alterisphingorhabdus coralli]|uniref:Tetratricopeptide repeat protein n=1 Tax=Alterisphingorhabdus coralli TaxID=3071408 RepID=A0AA97F8K1_9SPHN|nr:hypothetical protein [Parasphingorhabdus sp. SCSIO 66989]WOE75901.1 hypothetical protein RB602_04075 [Parasphingorhabdus sp. SCSIO 66989]
MTHTSFRAAFAAMIFVASYPLAAQTIDDLDILSEQTVDAETGIETARQQTERGELLEALATLERVLTLFPKSAEARFNHATLLCWIGDPQGAIVEFERLDKDDYAKGALKQAEAECAKAMVENQR